MKIEIINQRLYIKEPPETAEGTREYLKAEFNFSEDWSGLTKTAFFRGANGDIVPRLLEEDTCTVPAEVLAASGRVGVSVSGTLGETIITTDIESFFVPATLNGGTPSDPEPTLWQEVLDKLEKVSEVEKKVTELNERCDTIPTRVSQLENDSKYLPADGAISWGRKEGTDKGDRSVALGKDAEASGVYSFAEGELTKATGRGSHAEGFATVANQTASHAEGGGTIASGKYQHVQGKYNVEDTEGEYAHIVGGGADANNRRNIHTVDWDGNAEYAGDYWEINETKYRIADINYWRNVGYPESEKVQKPHILIVPDTALGSGQMSAGNSTSGGYKSSAMKTVRLNQIANSLPDAFKNILISHKMFSDGSWVNASVDLMNEVMVHGTYICTDGNNRQTSDTQQLALFRLVPELKVVGVNYWLRNVAGSQTYTLISQYGDASSDMATSTYGVRPVFAVG